MLDAPPPTKASAPGASTVLPWPPATTGGSGATVSAGATVNAAGRGTGARGPTEGMVGWGGWGDSTAAPLAGVAGAPLPVMGTALALGGASRAGVGARVVGDGGTVVGDGGRTRITNRKVDREGKVEDADPHTHIPVPKTTSHWFPHHRRGIVGEGGGGACGGQGCGGNLARIQGRVTCRAASAPRAPSKQAGHGREAGQDRQHCSSRRGSRYKGTGCRAPGALRYACT
jgi:hypothetical protein